MTDLISEATIASSIPVLSCELCPALCKSRKRIVNGRGPDDADIMVVGEGPGFEEDQSGRPFVGRAGQLIAKMLYEAGIVPSNVRLTNAIRCRPPGNRTPTDTEIAECNPYLMEEIRQVNPKAIIALGGSAIKALLGAHKVGDVAGQILAQPETGIPVIPTYHPSYIMRGKWGMVPTIVRQLAKAATIAQGKLNLQPLEEARKKAKVLRTVEEVEALRDYLTSDDVRVVVADTETTGLSWLEDELLCFSFSALDSDYKAIRAGFTIPLMKADPSKWPLTKKNTPKKPANWRAGHIVPYWSPKDQARVVKALRTLFDSGKPLCFQNAAFDIRILERSHTQDPDIADDIVGAFGFNIAKNVKYDTMLMQRIVHEGVPFNETAMLSLYTDLPYYESEIKEQSQDKTRMDLADNETLWSYAALDTDGGARMLPPLAVLMRKEKVAHIHRDIHIPMLRANWAMTRRGMYVDLPYFNKLQARFREITGAAEADVMEKYGGEWFNLRSPGQLSDVLFNKLALEPSGRKTKKSKECDDCREGDCERHDQTGKDALLDMKVQARTKGQEPHPILDSIIHWKFLDKRKNVYIDGKDGDAGLVQYIRPSSRVHPEYFVNRTDTGREAAYEPPIQTWPKEVPDEVLGEKKALRRTFAAPPGQICMEVDWAQGEVWVMAYESGDDVLLNLLLEGRDVHTYVARKFCEAGISSKFPKEMEDPELSDHEWAKEHGDLRKDAKVFVFGIDYGMTEMGIAERLVCPVTEAAVLRNFYLTEIFSKLDSYFARIEGELRERGYNEAWSGRRGRGADPEMIFKYSQNGQVDWQEVIRKQANMPIQAGLNDIHMPAHIQIEEDPQFAWIDIVLAVHDSCFGYTDNGTKAEIEKKAWQLKERFEHIVRNIVKPNGERLDWRIPVEVSWGPDWGNLNNTLSVSGEVYWEDEK